MVYSRPFSSVGSPSLIVDKRYEKRDTWATSAIAKVPTQRTLSKSPVTSVFSFMCGMKINEKINEKINSSSVNGLTF